MKYLIIGTGRSGTGFMSKLLTQNDIPCGHEEVCGYPIKIEDYLKNIKSSEYVAESSWLPVPYLEQIKAKYPKLRYIHITRDPIKIVKSFYEIEYFSDERKDMSNNKLVESFCDTYGLTPIDAAMKYYICWYKEIERVLPEDERLILDIDNFDYAALGELVGKDITPLDQVVNLKKKNEKISNRKLKRAMKSSQFKDEFCEVAKRYGFDPL